MTAFSGNGVLRPLRHLALGLNVTSIELGFESCNLLHVVFRELLETKFVVDLDGDLVVFLRQLILKLANQLLLLLGFVLVLLDLSTQSSDFSCLLSVLLLIVV